MPGASDDQLRAAFALQDLDVPADRRAQVLAGLDDLLDALRRRRAHHLDHDVAPATTFDPRPSGWQGMPGDGTTRWSSSAPGPRPRDPADVAFAPITRLAGWLRDRALSSRELTELYLERIDRLGPVLECWASVTGTLAREQADAADAALRAGHDRGPLHGIPYGAKDLLDTAGVPTTWGAAPYRERVPDRDATVVGRLAEAGAVLLGKTTLGALAYGDVWFGGRTRNPWNTEEGSSGSSAGSAAATAAGLCAFAIGSETWGSITSPADRCGATGLRPTFGRVGRGGAMPLSWSMDKLGPLCRTVEDAAMVLAAINGPDPDDPSSIEAPFGFDATAAVAGLRVGHVPGWSGDDDAGAVDDAVLAALRELDVELVEVAMPDLPHDALATILFAEAAASFEELTRSGRDAELVRQDDAAWPTQFRRAHLVSAVELVQADRLRRVVVEAFDRLFAEVDAIVGPLDAGPMPLATNMTGHPCLHLRAGFLDTPTRPDPSLDDGAPAPLDPDGPTHTVPRGVSLWGRLFDEGRLCRLGAALEAHLDVAARRPDLDGREAVGQR